MMSRTESGLGVVDERSLKQEGIDIVGDVSAQFAEILTAGAMRFVAEIVRKFSARREELLQRRVAIQADIDNGKMPDFLPQTKEIRESSWRVSPVPGDLQDRSVEIT